MTGLQQPLRRGGVEAAGDRVFTNGTGVIGEERAQFPGDLCAARIRADQPDIHALRVRSGRLYREYGLGTGQQYAQPARSVVDPTKIDRGIAIEVQKRACLADFGSARFAATDDRWRGKRETFVGLPNAHHAGTAFLNDFILVARFAAGIEPRAAASERRVAGKRHLTIEGEYA